MHALVLLLLTQQTAEPAPIDLATITAREAAALDGRLVVTPVRPLPLEAVDTAAGRDTYPVASDGRSERSVSVPAGRDVRGLKRVVGVLVVAHHPPSVGPGGTRFPAFVEIAVESR